MIRKSLFRSSTLVLEGPSFARLTPFDQKRLDAMTSYTGKLVARTITIKPSYSLSKRTLMTAVLHRPFGEEAMRKASNQEFAFRVGTLEKELEKLGLVRTSLKQSHAAIFPSQSERFYLQYIHEIIKQSCGNCLEVAILTHIILNFYFNYFIKDDPHSSPALKELKPVICGLNAPHDHAFNVLTVPPIGRRYTTDDICLVIDNWHELLLKLSPAEYQKHLSKSVEFQYVHPQERIFDLKVSVYEKFNDESIISQAIKMLQKEGILPNMTIKGKLTK